ncbi:MAG: cytochrome c, partial [Proteobacteria bacterium]|nr:cytochrome c [Pseudomonadota bacterium]
QDEMKKPPATSLALTDSEIIAKMNWLPIFDNNRINKFNTGFGGGATFTLAAVVYVDGFIPEEIEKTLKDEDLNRIYTSAEFVDKRYQARAKLSISSDPAFFKMEELPDTELDPKAAIRVYFLTSLKAGTTMIEASYEGKKLAAATTIATYTTAQITDGKARYTTAVAGATPSPSCLSCHGAQGGANHSPTWMAQFSDAALLSTIETGVNSDVNYKTKVAHKMTFAAPAQRDGIVAYLRSLPPAP